MAVVTVAAAVAALASTGIAGARAPSQTRGVTDDSIKVAGLGYSAFYEDSAIGAQAVFDRVNADGGINGRTFDFGGWNDDGSDPTKNLAEGRRLVQQEQVFAVLPTITPFLGSADFFEQQKVPFIGWGISTGFCNNDYAVGFTGCIVPPPPIKSAGSTWGGLLEDMFKADGDTAEGKTAAVISEDNDSGKTGAKVISASARAGGFKVVYAKNPVPPPPAVVSDYTPFANEIMSSNNGKPPDVVFVVTAITNVTGIQNKLLELGYQGKLTNAVGYDPRIAAQYVGSSTFIQFNAFESAQQGNTAMQQIIDEIRAVKSDQMLTQPVLAGYLSADLFVDMLKKTGKNLTAERFLQVANKNFKYESKDVTGPITFPQGHKNGSPCGTLVESDGSNYSIRVPFGCYKLVKVS